MLPPQIILAHQLAASFAAMPQVEAVALSGSLQSGAADSLSDIDLYIYTREAIPLEARVNLVKQFGGARKASMGMNYWGAGDEWIHAGSGVEVDANYFDVEWMQGQIHRVVQEHLPALGYTTCFWHTVRRSQVLSDPHGWFINLQTECGVDYPDELRHNILAYNQPVLRDIIPSYYTQIEKAVRRSDLISINHRLAALLASYFDILFALNRELHPGEKRLGQYVGQLPKQPDNMDTDLKAVLYAAARADERLMAMLTRLLDHLDLLLERQGFEARTGRPRKHSK